MASSEYDEGSDLMRSPSPDLPDDNNVSPVVKPHSQIVYEECGNSKKVLFVMCIGLFDNDGNKLINIDNKPWTTFSKKEVKPSRNDHVTEVIRQIDLFSINPKPRPSNWNGPKLIEWLEENPIKDSDCVRWIKKEVHRLHKIAEEANAESKRTASNSDDQSGGQWRGPLPYLRILMCLIEDDIKENYLRRADAVTRQELDACTLNPGHPLSLNLLPNAGMTLH